MKILVTGSDGLLGSAFKKILGENNGHIFHTRKDADLNCHEQTKFFFSNSISKHGIDTVIHCAALVGGVKANSENNEEFFLKNYKINNNVIASCFEHKIKNFVNILSTCIFPSENINYPLTPSQIDFGRPHESNFGYSYAKRLSGYETKIIRNVLNLNWFSIVPTNIYGPNDNFNLDSSHLIPGMIHRAYLSKLNNSDFTIWGDGTPLRQFIYSEDLANLVIWSLQNWKSDEHCMLVNPTEISVSDVAKIICKKLQIPEDKIKYDLSNPMGQFRKPAMTDITNFEFKKLEDGINETIDWFIKNYKNIRK
jgi:GDP-L-fucose synthase